MSTKVDTITKIIEHGYKEVTFNDLSNICTTTTLQLTCS